MNDLVEFGDLAVRFAIPGGVSRPDLLAALRAEACVLDAVLAEQVGLVTFRSPSDRASAEDAIRRAVKARGRAHRVVARTHAIDVVYDGEDLEEVARSTGLTRAGVIEAHASGAYEVAMLGFLPGFAYLRGLDPRLVLPRRASPRPRVPAGSLAIAAEYTGIYPFASSGGWHLLGRAAGFRPFEASEGARLALGDRVSFVPKDSGDAVRNDTTAAPEAHAPAFEVVRVAGPVLVIDRGRPGRMHEGVPPGGPLVPDAFRRANAAVGNEEGAAALEIYGSLELRALRDVVVAGDEGLVSELRAGDPIAVSTARRARAVYLAVAGGLDVPEVLGGRGTLLVAAMGGFHGRALRRGDRLGVVARARAEGRSEAQTSPVEGDVELLVGPDADAASLEALRSQRFRISVASDRTGTRLEAPSPLPELAGSARRASTPMVLGAIERTPHGFIVLGPDHPTTGGYPVVAIVASSSRSAFFGQPIGAEVGFSLSGP